MNTYDVVVIGAGVIGSSVAFQLAKLGAKNVLVLDRGTIGAGTTSQSSGILRTHYSVKENVELARKSWAVFNDFSYTRYFLRLVLHTKTGHFYRKENKYELI